MASSVSGLPDGVKAAGSVAAQCGEAIGDGPIDLAMLFFTGDHTPSIDRITQRIREDLRPECLVGVSASGVVGGRTELDRTPGISLLTLRLPGVTVHPIPGDELLGHTDDSPEGLARVARVLGADEALRSAFLVWDPFTCPMSRMLPLMNRARAEGRIGTIVGGMASAGTSAGSNVLVMNDRLQRGGMVGVSLKGPVRVDTVVSQGCRGVGPTFVVTAAQRNVLLKLGGRPALDVVRELVESMSESDRKLLERGLFIGRAISEYKDRFGRDDFLIHNVVGVEESQNALLINELARVGTTVRFHVRDAESAEQDLAMLLDAQKLRDPPAGGILVTCNGRGEEFFGKPNVDASAVVRAFTPGRPAEEVAKGGQMVEPERPGGAGGFPLAGFFAAGEIGPIGGESYVHGFTACLTLLRSER